MVCAISQEQVMKGREYGKDQAYHAQRSIFKFYRGE